MTCPRCLPGDDAYEPCRVCGEVLTSEGRTCKRCEASLEEERLDKEAQGF